MKLIGWTSFDSSCQGICIDKKAEMVDALRATVADIQANSYLFSGETHQNADLCVPVFDNGKCLRCSMRGWATIMSIAHTDDEASYMNYYMGVENERRPEIAASEQDFAASEETGGLAYYFSNNDVKLVVESLSVGMQLMTFDPAVLALYDAIKQEMSGS